MSRYYPRASRLAERPSRSEPSRDPLGAFLVKQRPEALVSGPAPVSFYHASEKISDPGAIAAILTSCSTMADPTEDDLVFELLYLETLLATHPLRSNELLAQLGSLGVDVREGLLPDGVVDIVAVRQRTRRLRQQMGMVAGRVTAALLVLLTSLPFFGQEADAKTGAAHDTFQIAAAPVVRVVDANSGVGVPGVQIKSMEEKLLGVTDATGQATLAAEYMETDLLSLEKEGYQMYLLDRTQLSSRNIVSMKPLQDGAPATALLQKAPTPPKAPEAPKVAVNDHTPTITPPKPPTAPKAPVVRLPARPRMPKQDAHTAPAVVAVAPKHEAPRVEMPKHEAPKAHTEAMSKPAKPPAPKVAQVHGQGTHVEAPSVAVPKRVPMPKADPVEAAEAPSSSSEYYKVRAGDTLSAVAYRFLGSANRWPEIYAANKDKLRNPHWIQIGEELVIPGHSGSPAAVAAAPKTYVVKPGDSLSRIAGEYLGDMSAWHKIYVANRAHIRNPHYIYPGQRLVIPS